MPVFVTSTKGQHHVRFHATKDCRGLNLYRRTRPVQEVELAALEKPEPCRYCYPDAPQVRVWRPRCDECGQKRVAPCPHNGGVLVRSRRRGQWTGEIGRSPYDPDLVVDRLVYVWPENAWRFDLVRPAQDPVPSATHR